MDPELTPPELPLMAGAVAIGAVCAMVAVLILFPVIDRFIRPRFNLERGGAMLLLLGLSLVVGSAAGTAGYFWLRDREENRLRDEQPVQEAGQSVETASHCVLDPEARLAERGRI